MKNYESPVSTDYRTLDLRRIRPEERALHVLEAFEGLSPRCDFAILLDREPKEIKRQMEFELGNRFDWIVLENGPTLWRIRIQKRV